MHRFFTILLLFAGITLASCAQSSSNMNRKQSSHSAVLVAYFSATGTTAKAASTLAAATGGILHAIQPGKPYTADDLDWHNGKSRSSVEMNDAQSRPALQADSLDTEVYDCIFLGYPIWWDEAPRIINTFIENHHLEGKRVIPFATSGSSSIDNSADKLKLTYPNIRWEKGRRLNGATESTIRQWAQTVLKP